MKKLSILLLTLFVTACSGGQQKSATGSNGETVMLSFGGDSKTPVAEINGVVITEKELNEKIDDRLTRIKSQIFDIQRQGISQIINDKLIEDAAKKANTTVPDLLRKEVNDKVGKISDEEIQSFYDKNKARFQGKSLDEVKANIQRQLYAQKSSQYRNQFLDKLKDQANIKVFLTRPKIDVSADDDPFKGGKNAKVTIIEFTDYQCPFCARARPTVKQILENYGDEVKYVLRDFPLSFHAQAQKAAEAAQCAGDQNKYWEYSEVLWQNARSLDVANLKKYAGQLKLDQSKFDQCLDSNQYAAEVKKDIADGSKAGVTGTPSFFINGQMLTGARPYEQFKEIIDTELRAN